MPENLYEAVVEVDERVVLEQESCELQLHTSIDTTSIDEKVRGGKRRRMKHWLTNMSQLELNACMYALR